MRTGRVAVVAVIALLGVACAEVTPAPPSAWAEYFFANVGELTRIGVIGLLFSKGNAGSTTNTDFKSDGITNPPPLSPCSTDGVSTGTVCNNHVATAFADDDGGYLRMAATAYIASPVALP